MRVLVFAADQSRCGHRLIWPAQHLVEQGHDVLAVVPGWSVDGYDYLDGPVDVVVIQRPMHVRFLQAIDRFKAGGAAVVVEVDDDMRNLASAHILRPSIQPKQSPYLNWKVLEECCRVADLVTVTTPALAARYGRHGRVAVIPNHVPASYLGVERLPHDGVWVGWSGTVATHPRDLQEARGAIGRAISATGAEMVVIGAERGVQEALSLSTPPWPVGFLPLPWYPVGMAQFDVGIVPLERSAFNEAKSYLKGLEFAALGVPFVASSTGPYRELERHAGIVAVKPKHWESALKRYITSPQLREDHAGRAREWAATQTIERNAEMWLEAWTRARTSSGCRLVTA